MTYSTKAIRNTLNRLRIYSEYVYGVYVNLLLFGVPIFTQSNFTPILIRICGSLFPVYKKTLIRWVIAGFL